MAVIKSEHSYPKLKRAEIALLSEIGSERLTARNEILFDPADTDVSIFVVLDGCLEIVRPLRNNEALVISLGLGEFSGEINLLLGDPSLVRGKSSQPSRLLEIKRDDLLQAARTRTSMSEVFLSSFLMRRAHEVSSIRGDSLLVGSGHSAGTLRLRAYMERTACPYTFLDLDRDSAVRWLLDQFAVRPDEIPILILKGRMLRNPSNAMVASRLEAQSSADYSSLWNIEIAVFSPGET